MLKLPPSLQPQDWLKKVDKLDKPYGLADDLKKLAKLFDALPQEMLDLAELVDKEAADDVERQLKQEYAKAAKAIADHARSIAGTAKKAEAEFKKSNAPKPAVAAAAALATDVLEFSTDVNQSLDKALAALKGVQIKIAADLRKEQAQVAKAQKVEQAKAAKEEEEDADAIAEHKDEAKFRAKVKAQLLSWFKRVKAEGAPRGKFTVVVIGKTWGVYLNKSAGESEKKIAMRLAGLTSGFKHCKGEFFYDPQAKTWVFEGPNIPVGRANATSMSLSLKPILGYAPRLRLQAPGEKGEDSDGADQDPDEAQQKAGPQIGAHRAAPKGDADGAKAQAEETEADEADTEDDADDDAATGTAGTKKDPRLKDPVFAKALKDFTDRLTKMKPRIVASPAASQLKLLVAQAGALAGDGFFERAGKMLDEVDEKIRKAIGQPPARPAAPAPAAAPGPAPDQIRKLRQDWATARSEAVRGIESLARTIEQEYRDEVDQRAQVAEATKKLRTLAAQLKDDLEKQLDEMLRTADAAARRNQVASAKTRLTEVLRVVAADPLMKEIDGNELMPSLRVVKPMQDSLRDIAAALG